MTLNRQQNKIEEAFKNVESDLAYVYSGITKYTRTLDKVDSFLDGILSEGSN